MESAVVLRRTFLKGSIPLENPELAQLRAFYAEQETTNSDGSREGTEG